MKKLLIILGFLIAASAQAQVLQPGQTPAQFRNAANTKFDNLTDSVKHAVDSVDSYRDPVTTPFLFKSDVTKLIWGNRLDTVIISNGDTVTVNVDTTFVYDSLAVHRGLIDLNYGWIYDIMNDSLPNHWSVISALKYDTIPALRTAIEAAASTGGDSHDAVTLDGTPDYITISGQTITRYAIDLANDITGQLSLANINATGTASSSTFLRGDGAWATPAGSGDLLSTNNLSDVADPATALSNLGGLAAADTVQLIWGDKITTTSGTGTLTIDIDDIAVADLSATGTPSATTYLRGDDTWATPSGGSAELDSTDLAFKGEIYPIHTFTQGTGHSSSYSLASGMMLTPFFNRSGDTLVVTSFVNSMYADSQSEDTVQIQILYNDTLGNTSVDAVAIMEGSPMDIVTDINGYAGLSEHTTIVNDTIPPDVWVWGRIVETTSGANSMVASTMSGYKVKGTFNENPFDSDVTAPLYSSSELGTYNDTIILVLLDEELSGTAPAVSAFSFYGGNTEIGLNAVTTNEDSLFVALDSTLTVFADSTLYLSYTVPGTNPLQDSSGNEVVAWVDSVVTNNLASDEMVLTQVSSDDFQTYGNNQDVPNNSSGNWDTLYYSGNTIQIKDSSGDVFVVGGGLGGNSIAAIMQTDTYSNDQYAKAEIALGASSRRIGVAVRGTRIDGVSNFYSLEASDDGTLSLRKFLDATLSTLETTSSDYVTSGDVIELRIVGDELTAYVNDVIVSDFGTAGVFVDTDITTGKPGVTAYQNQQSDLPNIDNWYGGDITY